VAVAESQPPILQITIDDTPVAQCPANAPARANQVIVPVPGLTQLGRYEVAVERDSGSGSQKPTAELFATATLRVVNPTDPRITDLGIEPSTDFENPGYDATATIIIPGPCPSWAVELTEVAVVGRDIELYFDALETPVPCGRADTLDQRRFPLGDLDSGEYRVLAYIDIAGQISKEPPEFWAQSDQLVTVKKRTERLGNANRFRITLDWQDYTGKTGIGFPVSGNRAPNGSEGSAVFAFFSQDNWELIVKVLDACSFNQHYWVFGSASTDVAYTLTVEDTETGAVWSFENELGTASPAITDTQAFACAQP
jgi:hypothetical protein